MPYQPNIPQAGHQISVSQDDLLQNFQSIFAAFDQNHSDFNTGVGIAGQHNFVQFNPQAAWPAIGSFPGTGGFFISTAAGAPLIYHTPAGADINLSTVTAQPGGRSVNLPSGLKMQFGGPFAGSNVGDVNVAFPSVLAHVYSIVITTVDNQPFPSYYAKLSGFSIPLQHFSVGTYNYAGTARTNACTFNYILIGD